MASSDNPGSATGNFLPPILETDRAGYVYYKIMSTILPKVLSLVVGWGCKKTAAQSYLDFLRIKFHGDKWVKYSKRWSSDEMSNKLTKANCDTFDVTFLYKLIPELFDDVTSLDSILREAKELRNEGTHNPTGSIMSPEIKAKIEDIIKKLLSQAGESFKIDEQERVKKIDEFIVMIADALDSVRTEKERSVIATGKTICKEGRGDIEETVKNQANDKLPFSTIQITRRKVFHSHKLLIKTDQEDSKGIVISCKDILKNFSGSCIIVTGDPGSGKSTLLRNLREDFVSTTKIFHRVKDYDLLLYMECRDPLIRSIPDLMKKNFPKAMSLLEDDQYAVDSIRDLKLLICVDGIDERNHISSELLNDLFDIFANHGQASFVLTSRPGDFSIVERHLSEKGLTFVTAHIQLLGEEKEQIRFLNRYKECIPGVNGDELIASFQNLEDSCKYNCMTHPVYLALFCHIFHIAPQAVQNFKNEFSVMEKLLELSKTFIRGRLILECVEDLGMDVKKIDSLASKLLCALCDLTVRQILHDKLIIDQRTYRELCAYTFGQLNVNYYTVLSCVLVGQEDQMFFGYLHKTNAEFLAAKAILTRLKNDPEAAVIHTICRVAIEYSQSMQLRRNKNRDTNATVSVADELDTTEFDSDNCFRFFHVFRFVLMGLCETDSHKESIRRSTNDICRALMNADSHPEHLFELTGSCPDSEVVAKATAAVVKDVGRQQWSVTTPRQMLGSSLILHHCQPITLTIDPPRGWVSSEAIEALMKKVDQYHCGSLHLELEHSYTDWSPVDRLVTLLNCARCRLKHFEGCLGSEEGQHALVQAVLRSEKVLKRSENEISLRISLLQPRQHLLAGLREAYHRLDLRVQLTDGDRGIWPLPVGTKSPNEVCRRGCEFSSLDPSLLSPSKACPKCGLEVTHLEPIPPSLTVVCPSLLKDWKIVEELVEDLAPEEKRFKCLRLQRWQGNDAALNQLVLALLSAGVRTDGFGVPLWAPADFDNHSRCEACYETNHTPEEGRCVELLPRNRCDVTSAEEMRAVTLVLTTLGQPTLNSSALKASQRHPSELTVSLAREVGSLPELLSPMLKAVAQWYKNSLHLVLEHSYWDWVPADEYLELLSLAECQLVEFRGCISRSEVACRAIAASVRRKQLWERVLLHIALKVPHAHPMIALGPVPSNTEVHYKVQLSDDAPQVRRPLANDSDDHAPSLIVECTQTRHDWNLVDTLIKNLAPETKLYRCLGLQSWCGIDESLDRLVWSLRLAGILTVYDGGTSWKPAMIQPLKDVTVREDVTVRDHSSDESQELTIEEVMELFS